jgi:hypothetical protein
MVAPWISCHRTCGRLSDDTCRVWIRTRLLGDDPTREPAFRRSGRPARRLMMAP